VGGPFNSLFGWLEEQKLEYQGSELEDDFSLESYQISNNSVIQLSSKARRYIFVEMFTGKTLSIFIDPDAPASHLQEKVEEMGGLPVGMNILSANRVAVTNCMLQTRSTSVSTPRKLMVFGHYLPTELARGPPLESHL
jgi:hypothetical protein